MSEGKRSALLAAAATHPGLSGKNNEDWAAIYPLQREDGSQAHILALCDGIGGHNAGEVASRLAGETILGRIGAAGSQAPVLTLAEGVRAASQAIHSYADSRADLTGMGSTCAIAWIEQERLYTVTVGDSRIYLLRDGFLRRLSLDHTWVQEAVDAGYLDETELKTHPHKHVIRRYLGSATPPEPDFRLWFNEGETTEDALDNQGLALLPGDLVLVCCDGLTDLVSDEEIEEHLLRLLRAGKGQYGQTDLHRLAEELIQSANSRGGYDNITVILAGFPHKGVSRWRRFGLWLVLGLVVLGALGLLVWAGSRLNQWIKSPAASQAASAIAPLEGTLQPSPGAAGTQAQPARLTRTPSPPPVRFEVLENGFTLTPWPTHPPGQ